MQAGYPVKSKVDHPDHPLNRLTTFFRPVVAIPIAIVLGAVAAVGLTAGGGQQGQVVVGAGGVVLCFLWLGVVMAVLLAWVAILFTGRYPRALFGYVEGVLRRQNRVVAYGGMLATDRHPPFRLRE